jgi:predicted RNase H-like HicB family nuclease
MQRRSVLTPDAHGGFVALNSETGTTTQGDSVEEALENLREATELFLETSREGEAKRAHAGESKCWRR